MKLSGACKSKSLFMFSSFQGECNNVNRCSPSPTFCLTMDYGYYGYCSTMVFIGFLFMKTFFKSSSDCISYTILYYYVIVRYAFLREMYQRTNNIKIAEKYFRNLVIFCSCF